METLQLRIHESSCRHEIIVIHHPQHHTVMNSAMHYSNTSGRWRFATEHFKPSSPLFVLQLSVNLSFNFEWSFDLGNLTLWAVRYLMEAAEWLISYCSVIKREEVFYIRWPQRKENDFLFLQCWLAQLRAACNDCPNCRNGGHVMKKIGAKAAPLPSRPGSSGPWAPNKVRPEINEPLKWKKNKKSAKWGETTRRCQLATGKKTSAYWPSDESVLNGTLICISRLQVSGPFLNSRSSRICQSTR